MNPITKIVIILSLIAFLSISAAASGSIGSANAWEFCAVGDITSKTVMSKMKAYNCEIHVLLGDYYGKESTFVKGFKETNVPVLAACGNHDSCKKVLSNDGMKFSSYPFAFKWKNAGFLILNTEKSISSQKSFGTQTMTKFQNDPQIDIIIVAQHKPAITNPSAHHKESEAKGYREQFAIWKQDYPKFNLSLFGHNHGYQVCKPDNPKLLVITDGTGGRTPYPWGSQTDDNCGNQLSGKQYNGYSIITIGDNSLQYKHVNAK